ncbi:hypothetical protein ZIOFF_060532 [Zingiber officinale]|uniref:Uncharacterized protein n=1 Tax=Zingiber officinale TaxID=94328 RepID=A0A8J5FAX7_ZINOF|nr:hypothetical protein ZIOFF_060532 [Zingiber officinale]
MKQGFAWEGKRRQLVAVWGSPVASPFEIAGPTSTSLSSRLSEVNPMAIRSFEASWKSNYSLKENKDILTGWEDVIAGIAKSLIKEQSPKQYAHVLSMVLVVTNYDITLFEELKKHLDEHLKAKAEFLCHKY